MTVHDGNVESFFGGPISRGARFRHLLDGECLDERIRRLLLLLSGHLPAGNKRDARGASLRQLLYICSLAGFDQDLTREFARIINLGGGLDSAQAHAIINMLKERE